MQYIAFDAHKHYTLASVATQDGQVVREERIEHERGALRQFLERCGPGSPVAVVNRLGYRTGHGNSWTKPRAATLRNTHGIAVFERSGSPPVLLHMDQAAAVLGVSPMTIQRLINRKVLPATQPVPFAPWAIRRDDLELEQVQRAIAAVKSDRRLPQTPTDSQLTLVNPHR